MQRGCGLWVASWRAWKHDRDTPQPEATPVHCVPRMALATLTAFAAPGAVALELNDASSLAFLCDHAEAPAEPATAFAEHVHLALDDGSGDCAAQPHDVPRDDVLTQRVQQHVCAREQARQTLGDPLQAGAASREYAEARGQLLLQAHETVVGADGLSWLPYDEDLGVLAADVSAGLPLLGGAWVLDVQDQALVPFEVSAEDAEELVALDALGALSMRVVFVLATAGDASQPYCVDDADGVTRISARLLAAELIDPRQEERRGWSETPAWEVGRVRLGEAPCGVSDVAAPEARVTSIDVDGALAASPSDVALLQSSLESRLATCYVEGIVDNARLQGALTLRFDVTGDGYGRSPEVTIDALDHEGVTTCAARAVQDLRVPRPLSGEASHVRATVVFRRAPE